MEAMRSVRKERQRVATEDRVRARQEYQLDKIEQSNSVVWSVLLGIFGGLAFMVNMIMLCAVTDGMPGPVRLFVGMLPLLISIGMVAFQSTTRSGIMSRWLEPVAIRLLIMLAVSFVLVALFSHQAAIALSHEGAWLFEAFPKTEPFTTMGAVSQSIANGLAGLFKVLAKIIPW